MPKSIPAEFQPMADGLDISPFHALIQRLRHPEEGCPWDKTRTLALMGEPLTSEAVEAAEALSGQNAAHQAEELGDVLLNVMLAVVIAEEEKRFTWKDVIEGVTAKLVRRHPHVFGEYRAENAEQAMAIFQEAKAKEKNGHA